jgi:hypothetical protein
MSNWTPERIEKQRELAKDLVAQGKFGGAGRGQGRKRKPRAAEEIARRMEGEGTRIFERLMEILENGTDSNSILAVRELRAIEENERKIEIQDERNEIEDLKYDQLLALVVSQFMELGEKGVIPREVFDVIDGEAREVEPERPSELSETTRPT